MVGRLTRDPELRRTGTGKAVCSFDIAIGRRIKDADTGEWKDADPTFVPIIVWGDQAERCGERLKKGVPVHVEGRLQSNKWEGNDGTKRSRLEVVASRVQFLFIVRQESVPIDAKPVDSINESQGQSDNINNDNDEIPF
ncbi:single-stranded DNA-binding protein [Candidatus Endomicrobiellum agilis]|uniref:single-stranded DNA-binding protein n=1 Tax=Candidatus Endomicrobiellum agilis TaxID=3238957 RepID=UPI0035A8AC49